MKLKIDDLYELQQELDKRIFLLHEVDRPSTRIDRLLALLVEVGEMINETKCFKYWSLKPASSKEIVLEEYGDGVHFLLSLGIDLNDQSIFILNQVDTQSSLSELTLAVYQNICALKDDFSIDQYHKTFSSFLTLGERLAFTQEDIRSYYLKKNRINHQRQDDNY